MVYSVEEFMLISLGEDDIISGGQELKHGQHECEGLENNSRVILGGGGVAMEKKKVIKKIIVFVTKSIQNKINDVRICFHSMCIYSSGDM